MEITAALALVTLIFVVAFIVEALVEFFISVWFDHIPALEKWKWVQRYFAGAVGIGMAFVYGFDLIVITAELLGAGPIVSHPLGVALTGASIGMGADRFHDIIKKILSKPFDGAPSG